MGARDLHVAEVYDVARTSSRQAMLPFRACLRILPHFLAFIGLGDSLREPGAPLDNNICERALKKTILHRKNSLFYKTANGARVGDLFMSLIHTCELSGANPFDYLTELQFHAEELARNPTQWMPWNYRATLQTVGIRLDTG